MLLTRQKLQEKREEILEIARRYGAHDVRIFGSWREGMQQVNPDLDLVVRFDPGRTLLDQGGLLMDLRSFSWNGSGCGLRRRSDRSFWEDRAARGGAPLKSQRSDRLRLQDILDRHGRDRPLFPTRSRRVRRKPAVTIHIFRTRNDRWRGGIQALQGAQGK